MQLSVTVYAQDPSEVESGDIYNLIKMGDRILYRGKTTFVPKFNDEVPFSVECCSYYQKAAKKNSFVATLKLGFCEFFITSNRRILDNSTMLDCSSENLLKALSLSNNLTEGDRRYIGDTPLQVYLNAAYYGLAYCYWRKGQFSESANYLLKTIQTIPKSSPKTAEIMIDALRLLGYTYAQTPQNYGAAEGSFNIILKAGKDPGYPDLIDEVKFKLGVILYLAGAKRESYNIIRTTGRWQQMYSHYNDFWNENKGDFSNRVQAQVYEYMKRETACKTSDIYYSRLWTFFLHI